MSDTPPTRIVRFGAGSLGELADVCGEAGISRPLLVASRRGAEAAAVLPVVATFDGVRPHVPVETVRDAAALVRETGADGLVGLGGGSAIDTCKAVVAELVRKPARLFRTSSRSRRPTRASGPSPACSSAEAEGGGMDERARPVAAIYDPELTVGLPLERRSERR
jgi:alcohol dehydrogenase class IV